MSGSDEAGWPSARPGMTPADAERAVFDAQVDARKKRLDEEIATTKAYLDADLEDMKAFHATLATVATDSIERARSGADTVQKAAAAVATLYTAVLGVAFSVSERPLPARGLLAPLFLGLAVVLATAYLAYLSPRTRSVQAPEERFGPEAQARERLRAIVRYARGITSPRSYLMRASVLALGVGLFLLPAPFLAVPGGSGSTASPASPVPWPAPSAAPTGKLGEILYAAQVEEAAGQRAAQSAPAPEDDAAILLVAGLAGLLVVALVPLIRKDTDAS